MKTILTVLSMALLIAQTAPAQAAEYPMNGAYAVRGTTKINMRCRAIGSFDVLGQTTVKMTVVSDASGVFLYDANGALKTSMSVSQGYQYSQNNTVLTLGRTTFTVDAQGVVLDGGKRQPSDIGFGPIHCEFPKN